MKIKFLLSWLSIFFGITLLTQAQETPADSNTLIRKGRPHFIFNLDNRFTYLNNEFVTILGLRAGLEWRNRIRAGMGAYFLSTSLEARPPGISPDVPSDLEFRYASVFGEYILLKKARWEWSVPVQLGYGHTFYAYQNGLKTDKVKVWFIEPSVAGHYKFNPYVGVGAGIGYRFMLDDPEKATRDLNAPIYQVKLKIFISEIYRYIRRKEKATEL